MRRRVGYLRLHWYSMAWTAKRRPNLRHFEQAHQQLKEARLDHFEGRSCRAFIVTR